MTAIEDIREIQSKISVIAISGGLALTPESCLEEAMRIGTDAILAKPIDREKLLETIQALL